MSGKRWLSLVSIGAALLGTVAGVAVIADEQNHPCSQQEGFIPGGLVPFVIAAWAFLIAIAIVTGWRSGWSTAKAGIVLGLVDLIGLPVLGLALIVAQVAQCIG